MPANFTEEQRKEIRERLIQAGYELSESLGLKKMTVAIIADKAGIATGTFYHFFSSKENFVQALIERQDEECDIIIARALNGRSKIPIDEIMPLYREQFRIENNFLMRLDIEDMVWLKSHLANKGYFNPEKDIESAKVFLAIVDGLRDDFDIGVVVNFLKTIYSISQNRATFCSDSIDTNIDLIFKTIYEYIKK